MAPGMSPPYKAARVVQLSSREVYLASAAQNEEDLRAYEDLRSSEHAKNDLIERLMRRVTLLNETLRKEINVRQLLEKQEYGMGALSFQTFKQEKDADCYVLVLVDGDSHIFNDGLLSKGELGGREAAGLLSSTVQEHLTRTLPGLLPNYKILVKVYANIEELAQICFLAGIIDQTRTLESFVRGFNGHELHHDFIDVGSGKDCADSKIKALLKLYLDNVYCRQIILGINHNGGCVRQLQDISKEPQSSSIYLLEEVPYEKELAHLKSRFKTIKFNTLFRDTRINVHNPCRQITVLEQSTAGYEVESIASDGGDCGRLTFSNPLNNTARSYASSTLPLAPVLLIPSDNPKPLTWAKLASTAPPPKLPREISPLPPPLVTNSPVASSFEEVSPATIARNIHGDRIDSFYPTTPSEWRRIQQLHLCNIHFLRQECHYGDKCTHLHKLSLKEGGMLDGSLSRRDLEILTQVSRYAPCRNGTGCDDMKCIFGHRCPVQENEGQPGKGVRWRECRHGASCKFPDEMHGIDTRVVKVTKI